MTIVQKGKSKSCIILDLDECLIHTYQGEDDLEEKILNDKKYRDLKGLYFNIELIDEQLKKGSGVIDYYFGLKRPNLNLFLNFCFSYFETVAVWSAGAKSYVHAIVANIFDNIGDPHIVYTRDDLNNGPGNGYDKPIQRILEDPLIRNYCDINRAFFIDDRSENFVSSPGNGVIIPKYSPSARNPLSAFDDIALLQLRQWLVLPGVISSPDVRKLKKDKIFKTKVKNNFASEDKNLFNISPVLSATEMPNKIVNEFDIGKLPIIGKRDEYGISGNKRSEGQQLKRDLKDATIYSARI